MRKSCCSSTGYWHGCVRCYTHSLDLSIVNGESMDERYERTLRVSGKIRRHGYRFIEKWKCDFDREYSENEQMKTYIKEVTKDWHTPLNRRDAFFSGRTDSTIVCLVQVSGGL
ncbi:hypothetical protein TSAR_012595 [Trichomalopsis sarcophagae]|uniref:Uncharacterized protein n=1 Tax=Trichomalopsis sarcophagae TaxID=543379 RepID=A0A232EEN5_9HYME|nr:hypothetical protein TSAR_012595 [Trichomalopsis sarcophagae]